MSSRYTDWSLSFQNGRHCRRGQLACKDMMTHFLASTASLQSRASSSQRTAGEQRPAAPVAFAKSQLVHILSALLPFALRLACGSYVAGWKIVFGHGRGSGDTTSSGTFFGCKLIESSNVHALPRPERPLVVFEFDACPFSKKVREMCSYLDLDVLYLPCPKGGPTFRPEAHRRSGKMQFPCLLDPNTGSTLLESDTIIQYLAYTYGDGHVPMMLRLGAMTSVTALLSGLPRFGHGTSYRASVLPCQPLLLFGYEASPFTRACKEVLCELEVPHLQISCARGSPKRRMRHLTFGTRITPMLEDPNTGVLLLRSAEVRTYLLAVYAH